MNCIETLESECKMVCSETPEVVYNLPRGNRGPPFFQPRRPADPNFYPNQPNQIPSMPPVYGGRCQILKTQYNLFTSL